MNFHGEVNVGLTISLETKVTRAWQDGVDEYSGTQCMTNAIFRAIALAAALLGASPARAAQPMTSTALILQPFVLTKLSDLSFGTIIRTGTAEFVQIDPETGSRTMTNEAMRVPGDEGYRARFASSGFNNRQVIVKLVGPKNLVNATGKLLKVTKLELDDGDKQVRWLSPASQVFFVGIGGEIFIRANQEDGLYTGTFTLTATYL